MVCKILLAWYVIFGGGNPGWTLATGIPSVWVLFCLVEWLAPRRKLAVYLVVDLLLTSVYFAVIMYYKYFGVIVTYHALQQVNQVTEVKSSVFSLLHPYFLLIYTDVAAFALALAFSRKFRAWGKRLAVREHRGTAAAGFTLSLILCVSTVLPFRDSMNEIKQAQSMGILNYEAYAAFAGSRDEPVDPKDITARRIEELKGITEPAEPAMHGIAAGKNVIIIQLEAFQNFLIDLKIDGQEITPNMNKLKRESQYFPHFFQQVGQGNTADAEFVVNTSFYVPPHGAASQEYAGKELPSMPRTLAAHGYQTATFHTNDVAFWNREELYKALGWDKYYAKPFFGDEDTVMFSASDEVLYAKTADELARMQQSGKPFYAQVISMSGHHPFDIPARKYKMKLPDRFEGTLVGDYIRAQNYADYALGQFVEKLKANGVWENSVVVLYGDHQGLPIYSLTSREKGLMHEIFGRNYTITDMMNIPLIVSIPGVQPQVLPQIGGQSDLFPTIANLLGISLKDQIHFGQDIWNQKDNILPERYYLPTGSLITPAGAFVPGNNYEDGTTYPIGGGSSGKPAVTKDQFERALKLLSMSDAYVQSLPNR